MEKRELADCPVEITLKLIGNKWKILILRELMDGTKRFGELKKSIGKITQKILTQNLREMEHDLLLERKVFAEIPPRVEYTLTETGYSLELVLNSLFLWGEEYRERIKFEKDKGE